MSSVNPSAPRRRRIIILPTDSDSDSDSNQIIQPPNSTKTIQPESSSNTPNNIVVTNGVRRTMKTPSILEKERQMKFLLDMFPRLEAMVSFANILYFLLYTNKLHVRMQDNLNINIFQASVSIEF